MGNKNNTRFLKGFINFYIHCVGQSALQGDKCHLNWFLKVSERCSVAYAGATSLPCWDLGRIRMAFCLQNKNVWQRGCNTHNHPLMAIIKTGMSAVYTCISERYQQYFGVMELWKESTLGHSLAKQNIKLRLIAVNNRIALLICEVCGLLLQLPIWLLFPILKNILILSKKLQQSPCVVLFLASTLIISWTCYNIWWSHFTRYLLVGMFSNVMKGSKCQDNNPFSGWKNSSPIRLSLSPSNHEPVITQRPTLQLLWAQKRPEKYCCFLVYSGKKELL